MLALFDDSLCGIRLSTGRNFDGGSFFDDSCFDDSWFFGFRVSTIV